jgi:hypothetical protein
MISDEREKRENAVDRVRKCKTKKEALKISADFVKLFTKGSYRVDHLKKA